MNHVTSLPSSSSSARRDLPRLCLGASLAAVAIITAWPSSAAAETVVGVDINVNNAVDGDYDDSDTGAGVDLYFGPRLDLAILTLTTELSGGFHDFGGPFDPTVYRGMAGGRLGIGIVVRPSVFAHVGVGHLRFNAPDGDDERDGRTNLAGDLGAALDFTLLPLVDLGIQGSYNVIAGNDDYEAFKWVQGGVHITFVLDGG
jgi:opacity protein-like surface antigen